METVSTKERILQSALMLFAVDGYEAVSVEMIAKKVGIKAPSLYKHYKGKRAIFESILARMEAQDRENAERAEVPSDPVEAGIVSYAALPLATICQFATKQFDYWTTDPFASAFRRLLTLEQYGSEEMGKLYQQYLVLGPLGYMTDLFLGIPELCKDASSLALSFYAPMFLCYGLADGKEGSKVAKQRFLSYLDYFCEHIGGLYGIQTK